MPKKDLFCLFFIVEALLLFCRLRRSNSQDLDVTIENGKPSSQFQRTAMRATLGARLAGDGRTTYAIFVLVFHVVIEKKV